MLTSPGASVRLLGVAELVIGARRSRTKTAVRSAIAAVLVVVTLAAAAAFGFGRLVAYPTPPSAPMPDTARAQGDGEGIAGLVYGDSSMEYVGDLAVLRLRGDPLALGEARGALAGADLATGTRPFLEPLERAAAGGGVLTGPLDPLRTRWRYRNLGDAMPEPRRIELAGAAQAAGAAPGDAPGYTDLLRAQASLDVGEPARRTGSSFRWVGRGLSFATEIETPFRDRLVVGRQFEAPGASDGGAAAAALRTVEFVRGDGAIPYASVGWPGLVGVVSGQNAEGIAIMVHPAETADVDVSEHRIPAPLLAREVLERARDLSEAVEILSDKEPLAAASFLVADGRAGRFAVVERSPSSIAVRRSPDERAVTGVLQADRFEDDAENDRAARTLPEPKRAERVDGLLAGGPLASVAGVAAALRGELPGTSPLPPGHRGAIDDAGAAHSAIFDVTAMALYVSEGPGAMGRFRAFDLRDELGGSGPRFAPLSPIPPAGDDDRLADAKAVIAARAELRRARDAQAGGRDDDAWAHIQRALARAPDLPEALALAGDHAGATGLEAQAEALYRRYLEIGADSPRKRDAIRARLETY